MGGGPDSKPEHLLVILPFEEPTEIFERIRKNHPNIKITFINQRFTPRALWQSGGIPTGFNDPHSFFA